MLKTILSLLLLCTAAFSMERVQVACTVGGKSVVTGGVNSTTKVQASYPYCTINVYITGSGGTHAAIYSDNLGTALANPFAADSSGHGYFYTANGHVDVQISGGTPSLPAPYTFGDIDVFDFPWSIPSTSGTGCWYSPTAGTITFIGCQPGGPNVSFGPQPIQYNDNGNFGGDVYFTHTGGSNPSITITGPTTTLTSPRLTIIGSQWLTGQLGITTSGYRAISTTPSFLANAPIAAGSELSSYSVIPAASATGPLQGGYMAFAPVLYNPYNSATACLDQWGNIVTQPLPLTGLANFTSHATVMWVSTSPTMPADNSCGAPIPVDLDYGLNINSYFLARGGLATDYQAFNSIHSLLGGVTAASITAGGLYAAGTVTHCCGTLASAAYIGGYVAIGHSINPPIADGNLQQTVAAYDNPLTWYDGLEQGTMYWDDTLHCVNVYNGSTWGCLGGGGSGSPGGPITAVQFNQGGAFGGSGDFIWNGTTLGVTGSMQATVGFNASGTSPNSVQAPNGGVSGKWLIATDSLFLYQLGSAPALSAAGQVRIYAKNDNTIQASANGGAYAPIGSPGGSNTQMQFNNSGVFGGSANLTWAANQLTVTGTVQSSGGFNASVGGTNTDLIQATTGGVTAKWLIALDSLFLTEEAPPALSAAGQARLFANSSNHNLFASMNGGAYLRIATNSGVLTNGDCASFDSSGNLVSAGGPCTTGGGGGTVAAGTVGRVGYYTGATTISSAGAMSWNNATQLLTVNALNSSSAGIAVGTGFVQADQGFLATSGTANNYNVFSAPTGGFAGKSGTFTTYVQLGNYGGSTAGGPTATTADTFHAGAVSYSTTSACIAVYDGAAWACISGGGGSGSPGGPSTSIQYNNAGLFAGTANYEWNNALNQVTITDGSGNTQNSGGQYVNSLASGVAGHTLWALATSGGYGLLRLSNGSGSGGFDGNGAQIYATGADGQIQATLFTSNASGSATAFHNSNNNFIVNGLGAVSANGIFSSTGISGGFNVVLNTAFNSFQSVGGINIGVGGSGSGIYAMNSNTVINASAQFVGSGGVSTTGVVLSTAGVISGGAVTAASTVTGHDIAASNGHYSSSGAHPTVSGSCTINTSSTDTRGFLFCTSGSSTTVTFNTSYASAPFCLVTADTGTTAYPGIITASTFAINLSGTGGIYYMCMQ